MRATILTIVGVCVVALFSGCGSTKHAASTTTRASGPVTSSRYATKQVTAAPANGNTSSETLRVASLSDPSSVGAGGLDPDVFYAVASPSVINTVYEGLLTYKPDSTQLVPALATSWKESSNGLRYTFQLRHGVHFHDGTLMTSSSVKQSFERRLALKQASSYLLGNVKSVRTPDPYTFIVQLKTPYSGFLDGLASMYGLKIIGPDALTRHSVGGDQARKWLTQHEDGTGPYRLVAYEPNHRIGLERFAAYWGKPAISSKVDISIIPDVGSQLLQLKSGAIDMTLLGITAAQLPSLAKSGQLQVATPRTDTRTMIFLNFGRPPFNNLQARRDFAAAIDVDGGVRSLWGDITTPARSAFPTPILNPDLAPVSYPVSKPKVPYRGTITLSYSQEQPDLARLAQYYQQKANAAGFHVALDPGPADAVFSWPAHLKTSPNALLAQANPDDSAPVDFAQVYYRTGAGVNLLGYSDPKVDRLIDQAAAAPSTQRANSLLAKVGRMVTKDVGFIQVADTPDVFVVRKGTTGLLHIPSTAWSANLATVRTR